MLYITTDVSLTLFTVLKLDFYHVWDTISFQTLKTLVKFITDSVIALLKSYGVKSDYDINPNLRFVKESIIFFKIDYDRFICFLSFQVSRQHPNYLFTESPKIIVFFLYTAFHSVEKVGCLSENRSFCYVGICTLCQI